MQNGSKVPKEALGLLLSLKMEEGAKDGSSHENINLPQFPEQEQPSLPLHKTPSETLLTSGILGSKGVNI